MIAENFLGYREGVDILQIPSNYLSYPSKNCLCYKGKVVSRLGTKNDGVAPTEDTRVHSEYVWKKAPAGAKSLRVWGTTLQVKWQGKWITIFDGFTAGTTRVRFTSWVDTNNPVIKSRLFMVDGSKKIFEWNGAIGTIASVAGTVVTISDTKTLSQLGFDAGNVTNRNVKLVRFSGGAITDITEYTHADTLSGNDDLTLTTTPTLVPTAGDLMIGSVIAHTDKLNTFDKDDIFTYKNHLFVANFEEGRIYYSHSIAYLDFVIPVTKTAITADLLDLDGKFTAMISRKNVLWISTTDDWFKVTKTIEQNEYGYWTNVEKFEQAESVGAKPYAVAINKGDVVFMGQDKLLRNITTLEITGVDDIQLISDGIDGLLGRFEWDDVRIYYHQRYIYVISANEAVTVMLDIVSGEFQPPQYIGITCISIIDNVRYAHSNSRNETMYLFEGRNDLGGEIEVVMATGFTSGKNNFRQQRHNQFGMHARATDTTICDIEYQYEEFGAKELRPAQFTVGNITRYEIPVDVSFGANPLATHTYAGIDDTPDASLKGFFIFDKQNSIAWFNFRPVFTWSGTDVEAHLLGWSIENEDADRLIGGELFINRT